MNIVRIIAGADKITISSDAVFTYAYKLLLLTIAYVIIAGAALLLQTTMLGQGCLRLINFLWDAELTQQYSANNLLHCTGGAG